MKKLIIAIMILALMSGTCFAGHGWRGHHGGWRDRGCGYNRGYSNNGVWIGLAGTAAALAIAGILSQPRERVIVRQVVPAAPAGVPYIVVCPNCGRQADVSNVPRGYRASCPYCGRILY